MATMFVRVFSGLCLIALLGSWSAPTARAQTTVRPYKFGFNIDEQQHRSEQRDERGIVMGEFGFITADGIYHVTVYATDEEGKFRILAMRSYPYEANPKTVEMVVVPKPKAPQAPKKELPKFNFNTMACSGCFLKNDAPTTKAPASFVKSKPKSQIQPLSRPLARISPATTAARTQTGNVVPSGQKPLRPQGSTATSGGSPKKIGSIPLLPPVGSTRPKVSSSGAAPGGAGTLKGPFNPQSTGSGSSGGGGSGAGGAGGRGVDGGKGVGGGRGVGGGQGVGGGSAGSPKGSAAGRPKGSAVGGGSGSGPGSGFKAGGAAAAQDGQGDLYRFKYRLDYNGHQETGSRNGNKVGSYVVVGDDNIERTLEYIANENGYYPKIKWRKLQTPPASKENTLQESEFVWFKE